MNVNSSEKVYVLCQGKVVQWLKWMEMEEGCIFEVMPPMKGSGKQKKKKKEEEEEEEEEEGRKQKSGSDVGREQTAATRKKESLTEGKGRKRRTWNLNTMREVMAWRRKAVKKVGGMRTRERRGLRRWT